MKYDFTTVLDRRGHDSLASDVIPEPFGNVIIKDGFDPIPMWVADMSFPTAPCVLDAIKKRMEMPNFGYFKMPDDYYEAIISWQARRNGVDGLTREHIGYENGVLGGVSSAVQAFTSPGDKILVHSPTYIGFTNTLNNLGRTIVDSPLYRDADGIWRMDCDDMAEKLSEEDIHFAIFCSPHNPTGRVWERWEIECAMEVFAEHDCIVISDEIWSDIILPGHKHIPTQSVSEDARNRVIAFYSPSKTFSLAGLVGSYHIIYNKYLRDRVVKQGRMSHYNDPNILSVHALIGAYNEGEEWCDEMISVIDENVQYACNFIEKNFKGVHFMRPQGTYMLYLDCNGAIRNYYEDMDGITNYYEDTYALMLRGIEYGVIWQDGEPFNWPDTIRINLALPKSRLVEAFLRLKAYVFLTDNPT